MSRASVVSGIVLLGLGAVSVVEALRVRDDWLGARLMPLVVGVVLVLLGVAHLVRRAGPEIAWPDPGQARRVALMLTTLVLYVAVMPLLGFAIATFLLALVLVRMLGAYSWPRTVLVTVAIAVGSQLVFQRWLGMPLP